MDDTGDDVATVEPLEEEVDFLDVFFPELLFLGLGFVLVPRLRFDKPRVVSATVFLSVGLGLLLPFVRPPWALLFFFLSIAPMPNVCVRRNELKSLR